MLNRAVAARISIGGWNKGVWVVVTTRRRLTKLRRRRRMPPS